MSRRVFDHLHVEISVCVGSPVPRYELWLRLRDLDLDPEALSAPQAAEFCRGGLLPFLAQNGMWIAPRALRSLTRSLTRYDAGDVTPYERMERWTGSSQ
jgi:hypothetical protein